MRTLNNIVQKWASPKAEKDDDAAGFFYPEWFDFQAEEDASRGDGNFRSATPDDDREADPDPVAESLSGCDDLVFDFGPPDGAPGWLG